MHEVIVYSRAGCHLCDDAVAMLSQFDLSPTIVDVDANDELRDRYGECVPVVVIDGIERFRGRIDPRLLRRIVR